MIGKELTQTMDENNSSWQHSFSQTLTNSSTRSTSHDASIPLPNPTPTTINQRIPRPVSLPRNHRHPKPHSSQSSKFLFSCPVSPRFTLPHPHLFILFTIFLFFSTCRAEYYMEERMLEIPKEVPDLFQSTLARLARSGTILVDQRPYFNPDHAIESRPKNPSSADSHSHININVDHLHRRTEAGVEINDDVSSGSNAITSTATILPPKSTGTSTLAGSTTSSGLAVAATATSSALPTPFDSGFSSNITSTCSSFMEGFLANETFKSCLPFSLLLQNSMSFFQVTKSVVRITQTLDASCSASLNTCTNLMNSLAANITATSNCASDLSASNPLVTQARLGLLAYKTLYTASCLKDPETSAYCYAQAITNSTSPSDAYIYFLPLNTSLPGGSQPTCNTCLKNTMQVYEAASADRTSAIAGTYVDAATQVNVQCGPGFVNQSLAAAAVTGAARRGVDAGFAGSWALLIVLWTMVMGWLV